MFIDGKKEENANVLAIWLDGPETIQNNNFHHEPSITNAESYREFLLIFQRYMQAILTVGEENVSVHQTFYRTY